MITPPETEDTEYVPKPLCTEDVVLPDELHGLLETLAENTHDVWAQRRLGEGWRYAPHRSDAERTHPDLVPYAALSDSEKDYDRATVRETLKAILVLGYRIVPPPD